MKEMFYSNIDRKWFEGERRGERTIFVDIGIITDTDRQVIEDQDGYRYVRDLPLEYAMKNKQFMIFSMI